MSGRIARITDPARRVSPQQIGQHVRHFFDVTGITYNRALAERLKRYSLDQIQQITSRVNELQGSFAEVRTLIIDDIASVPDDFDFNTIPAEQLQRRLMNGTLNLMGNWQAAEPFAAPYATLSAPPIAYSDPAITKLGGSTVALMATMGRIGSDIASFAQLSTTSVADIYGMLEEHKEELGFLNVSILRPVGEGRWVRSQSTRSWGPTKYDPATGGNAPEGTLKSVIDGGNAPHLYDVDINDRSTFEAAGLVYDETSVQRDLADSEGQGRMLFIVLPGRSGVRAVVQICNRINPGEKIDTPPVLPENEKEATALKGALKTFFVTFNLALQAAMERELMTSSGEKVALVVPDAPTDFVERLQTMAERTEERVERSPRKALPSKIKILSYLYVIVPLQTIRNLYRAIPSNYGELKAYFGDKSKQMKEAGSKKVASDFFKTLGRLCLTVKDQLLLWMPHISRTTVTGRFAFLVHPRDIDDIYRVFPFFKYLPTSLVLEIVKYLPPLTLSKMDGLKLKGRKDPIDGLLLATMIPPQIMIDSPLLALNGAIRAVSLAEKRKVGFLGLGALVPALTRYGTVPRNRKARIGITTGHAYTSLIIARTALKVKSIIAPASEETIAVVGAAGSTGSASAKILAASGTRKLLLIDLEKKREALEKLKSEIIATDSAANWEIELSTELSDIKKSRIIVTVTNSPKAIITSEMLRPGMIFVDDAQPPNISEEVANQHPEIRVLKVLADVPNLDTHFDFGLGTPTNITFTCLAEACAFAMNGVADDGTVGFATPGQIIRVSELTQATGISIPADFYGYGGAVYSPDDIRSVAAAWALLP